MDSPLAELPRDAETDYERYRGALAGRRLPLAFVDVDRFDQNAGQLVTRAGGKPIRVASKSLRCRALILRALGHPGYSGVLAFTGDEAAFLAAHGIDDVLVAYPTIDPTHLRRLLDRVAEGGRLTVTVDDSDQVSVLGALARDRGVVLPVCLDIDMSLRLPGLHFGVRRSPLATTESALAVAERVQSHPHLRLDGVLGYEAQLAGLPDDTGKKAVDAAVRGLKARSRRVVAKRRGTIVQALRDAGHTLCFVNGGGTGSLETTARDPSVTEVSAGSGLFAPGLFDGYRAFAHRPAAGFALPVVRRPAPGFVTCLGGGYVASGTPGPDKLPIPWLPPRLQLLPHEGVGEVQTPLEGSARLTLGDPVFFRHAKSGELAERFESFVLVQGDVVIDEVPTYRGEGRCFL